MNAGEALHPDFIGRRSKAARASCANARELAATIEPPKSQATALNPNSRRSFKRSLFLQGEVKMAATAVGIDVSNKKLDVHILAQNEARGALGPVMRFVYGPGLRPASWPWKLSQY